MKALYKIIRAILLEKKQKKIDTSGEQNRRIKRKQAQLAENKTPEKKISKIFFPSIFFIPFPFPFFCCFVLLLLLFLCYCLLFCCCCCCCFLFLVVFGATSWEKANQQRKKKKGQLNENSLLSNLSARNFIIKAMNLYLFVKTKQRQKEERKRKRSRKYNLFFLCSFFLLFLFFFFPFHRSTRRRLDIFSGVLCQWSAFCHLLQ